MEKSTNYNFITSNNTPLIQLTQTISKPKHKRIIYNNCSKCDRRNTFDENNQICHLCRNKIIDDFIIKTEFVPYNRFKNVEFIAEGEFSRIYKATWIDGPISQLDHNGYVRHPNYTVVLRKKFNFSKNSISKKLNEFKVFYDFYDNVSEYFGITYDPITRDIMIIMPYYRSGELIHHVIRNFYNYNWSNKLSRLRYMINGFINMHSANIMQSESIIHKSGNKIIDDFIAQTNYVEGEGMKFVPYDQFKNIEYIAEGGFSKIYKATWIDNPTLNSYQHNYTVVLKKLNDSKNITSKELNELKIFHDFYSKWIRQRSENQKNKRNQRDYHEHYNYSYIVKYSGITQDPITKDIVIIMPYYWSGDLSHYIAKNFYSHSWYYKLLNLKYIINGLINIHSANIIHRDLHSGNIFFDYKYGTNGTVVIGDLGISKSATESTDDDENYGIIPYMAPEIFLGQKHTKASDIYSFGMIMWELMTGRRPFWDENHDAELMIEIVNGLRPPIVTSAPEDYIELMKECWHSDPEKRPSAADIYDKISKINIEECKRSYVNPTKIIKSPDVGPVTMNNPGAIYKSRPLSKIINSVTSLRNLRSESINLESVKRKFEDNLIEENNDNGQNIKRKKLFENENDEIVNISYNNEYITREFDFDITVTL